MFQKPLCFVINKGLIQCFVCSCVPYCSHYLYFILSRLAFPGSLQLILLLWKMCHCDVTEEQEQQNWTVSWVFRRSQNTDFQLSIVRGEELLVQAPGTGWEPGLCLLLVQRPFLVNYEIKYLEGLHYFCSVELLFKKPTWKGFLKRGGKRQAISG